MIKEYESERMKEEILPLFPKPWHDEMKYFIEDEFENKIKKSNIIKTGIKFKGLNKNYNKDEFSPLDGELIQVCDKLATFTEANLSIKYELKSKSLLEGRKNIYKLYKSRKVSNIDFGRIFDYFYKKQW